MMALLRRAFFYDPAVGQVWESRSGLPPIKVVSVTRDAIMIVKANIAFKSCWEPDDLAIRYAGDRRQWKDRLAEERRRLKR
jgi:hypothetical protein